MTIKPNKIFFTQYAHNVYSLLVLYFIQFAVVFMRIRHIPQIKMKINEHSLDLSSRHFRYGEG